jgi:hypothetical protein
MFFTQAADMLLAWLDEGGTDEGGNPTSASHIKSGWTALSDHHSGCCDEHPALLARTAEGI